MQYRSTTEHRSSPRTSSIISRGRNLLMGDSLSRHRSQQTSAATTPITVSKDTAPAGIRSSSTRSYTFTGGSSSRRDSRSSAGRSASSVLQSPAGAGSTLPGARLGDTPVASRTRFGGGSGRTGILPPMRVAKTASTSSTTSSTTSASASRKAAPASVLATSTTAARRENVANAGPSTAAGKSERSEQHYSTLLVSKRPAAQQEEQQVEEEHHDLLERLKRMSLQGTFGILHAVGLRHVEDLAYFTKEDFETMSIKKDHAQKLVLLSHQEPVARRTRTYAAAKKTRFTIGSQSFFQTPFINVDFQIEPISTKHKIYKGRFLSVEQCKQIVRMSEVFAYQNTGWRPEIYTLTNLDLHVKAIPTMLSTLDPFFQQAMMEMPELYEECKAGSVKYRNDNEPHLVKYTGDVHKGVCMHTDSAEITLNIALSDPDDFEGGGTFFECLNKTIMLEQGEMLIHPGSLKHQGTDVSGGVRHILVAFMSCNWTPKQSSSYSCLR